MAHTGHHQGQGAGAAAQNDVTDDVAARPTTGFAIPRARPTSSSATGATAPEVVIAAACAGDAGAALLARGLSTRTWRSAWRKIGVPPGSTLPREAALLAARRVELEDLSALAPSAVRWAEVDAVIAGRLRGVCLSRDPQQAVALTARVLAMCATVWPAGTTAELARRAALLPGVADEHRAVLGRTSRLAASVLEARESALEDCLDVERLAGPYRLGVLWANDLLAATILRRSVLATGGLPASWGPDCLNPSRAGRVIELLGADARAASEELCAELVTQVYNTAVGVRWASALFACRPPTSAAYARAALSTPPSRGTVYGYRNRVRTCWEGLSEPVRRELVSETAVCQGLVRAHLRLPAEEAVFAPSCHAWQLTESPEELDVLVEGRLHGHPGAREVLESLDAPELTLAEACDLAVLVAMQVA